MADVPGVHQIGAVRFLVLPGRRVVLANLAPAELDEGPPELLAEGLPRSTQHQGAGVAVPGTQERGATVSGEIAAVDEAMPALEQREHA
jgi:hypothetical protein